jgi:hypothetical protein
MSDERGHQPYDDEQPVAADHLRAWRPLLRNGPPPVPAVPSSFSRDGWAAASEEVSDGNLLWRQYVLFSDLYRYYIDLIWKAAIWFYTAIGAALAYFFAHFNAGNHTYLPLLLPFLAALGAGMAQIFTRVMGYVAQMEDWLEYIAVSLRLPGRPHVEFIRWFCKFVSATLLAISAACTGFFIYLVT